MTVQTKELVVISGKGGTGKTSLMAAFAALVDKKVLCDADVDAADLHLLMAPDIIERHDFLGGGEAIIDAERCTECGYCRELCRWDAINDRFEVEPIDCEGCGVCVDLCPENAIDFPTKTCGEWYLSDCRFGPMVHARLGIAEENSGKLVALVRQEAKKLADEKGIDLIITDGPPGVGCPVIASIGGASALIIVTEPTVTGLHDMDRVAQLAAHFKVPAMVCLNKYDLNQQQAEKIKEHVQKNDLIFLGQIPFEPAFVKSMVMGKTIMEYGADKEVVSAVQSVWENILKSLP